MKKIYLTLLTTLFALSTKAAFWVITIFGTSYSPPTQTVVIGDVVTIQASTSHSLAQVSAATWAANGTTSLASGFGIKTANYQFTVTAATSTLYFVCQNHVGLAGMKGQIILITSTGLTTNFNTLTNVSLFPNPTNNQVNVVIPANLSDVSLKLIGVNGQEIVLDALLTNGSEYSTYTANLPTNIATGLYFIEVKNGEERIYKKIVITK